MACGSSFGAGIALGAKEAYTLTMQNICSSCSRGMPVNLSKCMYCGGAPETTSQEDPQINCPRCNIAMNKVDQYGVTIDHCAQCSGVWYDRGELETLMVREAMVGKSALSAHDAKQAGPDVLEQTSTTGRVYLKCPRCHKPMMRQNYMRVSAIMVDACGWHGMFLDSGELAEINAFHAEGGDAAAAQRAREDADLQDFRSKQSAKMLNRLQRGTKGFWR